jgi:hypothetical protein
MRFMHKVVELHVGEGEGSVKTADDADYIPKMTQMTKKV